MVDHRSRRSAPSPRSRRVTRRSLTRHLDSRAARHQLEHAASQLPTHKRHRGPSIRQMPRSLTRTARDRCDRQARSAPTDDHARRRPVRRPTPQPSPEPACRHHFRPAGHPSAGSPGPESSARLARPACRMCSASRTNTFRTDCSPSAVSRGNRGCRRCCGKTAAAGCAMHLARTHRSGRDLIWRRPGSHAVPGEARRRRARRELTCMRAWRLGEWPRRFRPRQLPDACRRSSAGT